MPHRAVHDRFLDTAAELSPELVAAIQRAGPQPMRSRAELAFPVYLFRAIAGQQISVKAAQAIWGRVEASAGPGGLLEHLAGCSTETLRGCGLSGAKTKTIQTIARTHFEDGLDAELLRRVDAAERAERLTRMWGVGQWTADMANMFYFGEEDIWPDGDVAARKTLERLTSKRRKTVRTAARFAPHRSYLAMYMWAHVDAPPEG
jgi:DNA-3-methyladenine glycosylase II